MDSFVKRFTGERPKWLDDSLSYEVVTGSHAYGCAVESSDMDISGFCVPPKDYVFPHVGGAVWGFHGTPIKNFEQWINKSPDVTIFNIIKFFNLIINCNPNIIDILYVPEECVLHCDNVGKIVRENRHIFLSKKAFHSFKGYAYSQIHKIKTKTPEGKRKEIVSEFGYDVKFAYHVVRLVLECRQILKDHNLILNRDAEIYREIRNGYWGRNQLIVWFDSQLHELEKEYEESTLRYSVDLEQVSQVLFGCLEEAFGSLQGLVNR